MTKIPSTSDLHLSSSPSKSAAVWSRVIGMLMVAALCPIYALNGLLALLTGNAVYTVKYRTDALGRNARLLRFNKGLMRRSAVLIQIATGELSLCGASFNYRLSLPLPTDLHADNLPSGLVSLHDCQEKTGLSITSPDTLFVKQSYFKASDNAGLLVRYLFNALWFRNGGEQADAVLPLFGLQINNTRMHNAINWFAEGEISSGMAPDNGPHRRPRMSFFINANSINLAQRNAAFKNTLKQADCLFADGSGMRLAAKVSGYKLLDNINGTDVLPLLCQKLQHSKQRLFLLGAAPGIAAKVSQNLQRDYPNLMISGTQHGFFQPHQDAAIITQINQAKSDVVLVAQGSPLQESWIIKHASTLECDSIIAVGGLFDFYSGNISRAPMWMRETGLEWVWRLLQEPVTKFKRYILGVPEFMFRTFILKQACQE